MSINIFVPACRMLNLVVCIDIMAGLLADFLISMPRFLIWAETGSGLVRTRTGATSEVAGQAGVLDLTVGFLGIDFVMGFPNFCCV